MTLFEKSIVNEQTRHWWYARLERQPCITSLDRAYISCIFRARVNMFERKADFRNKDDSDLSFPFCKIQDETFDYILKCESGLLCKNSFQKITLTLSHYSYIGYLEETGKLLPGDPKK